MIKKFCLLFVLLLVSNFSLAASVTAIPGVKTIASQHSVSQTTALLAKHLRKDRRFVIKQIINHQKIAAMQGHRVSPNMEIEVGCPDFDYLMVKANPQASLFTPLRIVIWQNKAGRVYVSYWDPNRDIVRILDLKQTDAIKTANWVSQRLAKIIRLSAHR